MDALLRVTADICDQKIVVNENGCRIRSVCDRLDLGIAGLFDAYLSQS